MNICHLKKNQVTRLNTYGTIDAIWTDKQIEEAKNIKFVTFASPSAVRAWKNNCGTDFVAITIGPTSAKAANSAGFKKVLAPENSKGLEAWADLIIQTVNAPLQ